MADIAPLPFPPREVPFLLQDGSGRVNEIWLEFIIGFFGRTGGESGNEQGSIPVDVTDLQLDAESMRAASLAVAALARLAEIETMLMAAVPQPPMMISTSDMAAMATDVVSRRADSDDIRILMGV
ncbi:hypothetical protein [Pandoraea apista]|uniref:hypothetical protein n=1 Tax=Pandoraea apista TaxID=93218 RepID=UPI0006595BED|nr:hypothetical protein [Pandoraea apista]ALS63625.1 hypothetical protein AT395_00195 [Pandoraea apista]CFB63154.1 hypothetical protein LMG16407_03229 [Pandoraea apista]